MRFNFSTSLTILPVHLDFHLLDFLLVLERLLDLVRLGGVGLIAVQEGTRTA